MSEDKEVENKQEDCNTCNTCNRKCCCCNNLSAIPQKEERWYHQWRLWSAFIYLIICVFDFLGMPVYYEITNVDPIQALEMSMRFAEPKDQLTALQIFISKRAWVPITLATGGLFHLAFGAILGVASFTRGKEKLAKMGK